MTNDAAALHSQITVPASSSGSPKRPAGVAATIRSPRAVSAPDSSSRSARFCSPTKKPGATAFTRTPCGASSTASHRVRFSTAAFAAP